MAAIFLALQMRQVQGQTRPANGSGDANHAAALSGASVLQGGSAGPSSPAPTGEPSVTPAPGIHEDELINRNDANPSTQPAQTAVSPPSLDATRVTLALGAVIGLILLLRWGGRKLFPSIGALKPHKAVQVLSRTAIGPKQQLLLIRIGRRVLAVGDTGTQLTSLCQFTEADEVAALVGEIRNPGSESDFPKLMGKASVTYDRPAVIEHHDEPAGEDVSAGVDEDDEGNPIHRDELRSHEPLKEGSDRNEPEPAVDATKSELEGLARKVRFLSQQFGQE